MGLAERRAIKAFETDHFPELKSKVDAAAGFEIDMEVDWSSLAVDDYAHLYEEAFPKVFFEPLRAAFADITRDDMGKEALQESLKKVVVKNEASFTSPQRCFTFEGGVLTFDHKPVSNIDDVDGRTKALVALLEKAL